MTILESDWIRISRFLGREAMLLDMKAWAEWISIYTLDSEYWVPAWADDGIVTEDPKTQISLIYYPNRAGLEDRVYRMQSGQSAAGNLEVRTCHTVNLVSLEREGSQLGVRTHWHVDAMVNGNVRVFFGCAEYQINEESSEFRIARKKTTILNDRPDTLLDFYLI